MKIIISLTVLSLAGIIYCVFRKKNHMTLTVLPSEEQLRGRDKRESMAYKAFTRPRKKS